MNFRPQISGWRDWLILTMCGAWLLCLVWIGHPENNLLKALWSQEFTGWLAIAVNVGGLYLIWGQLKASRHAVVASARSADAAAEAAELTAATNRAWLTFAISKVVITFVSSTPTQVTCAMHYSCRNVGSTPALDCSILFRPFVRNDDSVPELQIADLLAADAQSRRPVFPGEDISSNIGTLFEMPLLPQQPHSQFGFIGGARYRLRPDGPWKSTVVAGYLTPVQQESAGGIQIIECSMATFGSHQPSPT